MIVETILELVLGALTALLDALPDLALPTGDYVEDFAQALGGALGGLDGILPIEETATVVSWILVTYLPIVLSYNMARWVYTHLPVIGNGG